MDDDKYYCGRCGGWVRHLVCERVAICCTCGAQKALRGGQARGKWKHLPPEKILEIRQRVTRGEPVAIVAESVGTTVYVVYYHCKDIKKHWNRGRGKNAEKRI